MPLCLNLHSPVDFQTWKPGLILLCSFGIHLIQDSAFQRTNRSLSTIAQVTTHLPWLYPKVEAKRTIHNIGTIHVGENVHHVHGLYINGQDAPICWEKLEREEVSCRVGTLHTVPHSRRKWDAQGRISHGVTGSGIQERKHLVSNVQPLESSGSTDAACAPEKRPRDKPK